MPRRDLFEDPHRTVAVAALPAGLGKRPDRAFEYGEVRIRNHEFGIEFECHAETRTT